MRFAKIRMAGTFCESYTDKIFVNLMLIKFLRILY